MAILSKHKRNGADGFKRFVQNLEDNHGKIFENIVQMALLEDPLYMKWIIPNMISYEYIMKYNDDHVTQVAKQINNAAKVFVVSFYGTKIENKFVEDKLNNKLKRDYMDEKEVLTSIKEAQQVGPRGLIVQAMRKLQNNYDIPPYNWKLPPSEVMDGSNHKITPNSVFKLNFENGEPALIGRTKGKSRNGIWQHFYPNGNPMAIGEYGRGIKTGEWKFLYSNRVLKAEGKYVNDNKEGTWIEYDKQGNVKKVQYQNGKKKE